MIIFAFKGVIPKTKIIDPKFLYKLIIYYYLLYIYKIYIYIINNGFN
jgi:hypothetical protein